MTMATTEHSSVPPAFGLALGGGAVLGYTHIGILAALEAAGLQPAAVSGTSAGAVVAALHAFGVETAVIRRRLADLSWRRISGVAPSHRGLLSNHELGRRLVELIGDVRIEDARVPLAVVATDIASGEEVVFREGSVADAVMASACIPGVFVPIELGGRLLVDGALVEDVPISPLQALGAAPIVGVSLCARPRFRPPRRLVEVLTNAINIAIAANSTQGLAAADVAIRPDLTGFNRFDIRQCPALFEVGYAAGRAAVPALEQALLDARCDSGRVPVAGAPIQPFPTTHPEASDARGPGGTYPSAWEATSTSRRSGEEAPQRV